MPVPSRWFAFAAVSLLFFLVSAGTFSSMGVVLPSMVKELGWNWKEAGLGYTFLGLACGLASFVPAFLIRAIGVKGNLFIGMLVLAAGFAALALARSPIVYLAATLLLGLGFSLNGTVPGTHVLTGMFRRKSAMLGAYFTIGALGGVAGPLVYVIVDQTTHGWRPYWWTFVAASVLFGLFAIAVTPTDFGPPIETQEQVDAHALIQGFKDWTVRAALRKPQYYVIVGAYTMYLLVNTTAHGFGVEHLRERGVDKTVAAAMMSLEALIGAVVSLAGGVIGEKIGPKALLVVAMTALTLGMAGLAEARGYPLMLVYAVGMGIGFGLTFIASTVLLLDYFGKPPNLELYSTMCLISTSAALGPAVGGWARDTFGGFTDLFLLCAGAAALMLVATVSMRPPSMRREREPGLMAKAAGE
jgi:MFS family permease